MAMPVSSRPGVQASLAAAAVTVALTCAQPARVPGDAAESSQTPETASLTWLLSDEVMVLPTHEASLGTSGPAATESVRFAVQFDSAFRELLQPHALRGWMWPADLHALRRRNPLNVPDPSQLATAGLRGARLRAEAQLSPELGSQIRALTAVSGARRYVLLPLHLHSGETSRGGHVAGVTLVAIDARRAVVVQTRSLATGLPSANAGIPSRTTAPATLVRDLAQLALAEFVGSARR